MRIFSKKRAALWMAVIAAVVMAVTFAGSAFAEEEEVIVLPAGNFLVVPADAEMPQLIPGREQTIEIPVVNTHGGVTGAQVSPEFPDGITLNSASTNIQLGYLPVKATTAIPLELVVADNLESGIYTIRLRFSFLYYGIKINETVECNVMVGGSGSNGAESVFLRSYKVTEDTIAAGGNFQLELTFFNESSDEIRNGTVRLEGLATGGFTANGETDVKNLTIGSYSEATVCYQLCADRNMTAGSYPLTVTTSTKWGEASANIYLPVKGKAGSSGSAGASTPLIVIESYDYGEASVLGGSTFTLTLNVKNTSAVTAIENVKMTVSSSASQNGQSGAFTPASSSNTFYIPAIGAGQTMTKTIDLTVRSDAVPDSYGIDADFSYEAVLDDERRTITASETITVPVVQPNRFEVGELSAWGPIYFGDTGYVSVNYVNKGKTTIYNLQISAEGNFTTAESDNYVGNVESGVGDYFELEYSPTETGTVNGTLIFSYEDANGSLQETRREFSVDVIAMEDIFIDNPTFNEDDMFPVEEEKTFPWGWAAAGAAAIAVAAGGVVFAVKKKKAKGLAEADFDDEE